MSYSVKGNTITLTRGDTFCANVEIYQPDGITPYEPREGDSIRFAMKERISDEEPLLLKEIPINTMKLVILPEETKELKFGSYLYDIQLTRTDGTVDTFITKSKLNLTEEVY